jgi:two-component system NtrC family sensor kinase
MITVYILAVSIALQFAAAFLALRLIRVTGRRLAWSLISAALIFMAVRRLISFSRALTGELSKLDPAAELIALGISILMVAGIAGIAPLFSAIRRSKEALKESEERFRLLYEQAPMGYQSLDINGNLLEVNNTWLSTLGYTREEVIGRWFGDFLVPGYQDDFRAIFLRFKAAGEIAGIEFPMVRKDGSTILVSFNGKIGQDKSGDFKQSHCVFTDITERKRAEEKLSLMAQEWQLTFDSLHDAVWIMDEENRVLRTNPAAEKLFHCPGSEIVGRHCWEIVHGTTQAIPGCLVRLARKSLKRESMELQLGAKWLDETVDPILDKTGSFSGAVHVIRDITDHKRTEEALRESEERYRIAIEASNDGIAILQNDVHVYVNKAFLNMFGYNSMDEIIGMPPYFTVHPDDRKLVMGYSQARQKGEYVPTRYEFKGIRRDGTLIQVEISANTILYKRAEAILVFLRDITDRKRAEEEIIMERSKLKTLSDNAPFGMVLIDKESHFTYINSKFTELFGFDLSDVPDGRTWFRKAYPNTEYRHTVIAAWIEEWRDAKPEGALRSRSKIFTVTCKDGTLKIVSLTTSVLTSGDYLMTIEDITEMRRLESQFRHAQKMEAIGTLAGGIAHDFNNILTSLMGYASLTQMKMDTSDPLRLYVDQILSASHKAADLIRSLLTFSRQQPVTITPVDVNNLIKTTEKLLKRLLTEDIELHTSVTQDSMIVMADKSQIDQILFNLATNARDAMVKGGTLTIETDIVEIDSEFVRVHGFGEPGRYVQINVSDTGTGMDEATRENIFTPFFTTKEVGKGTGLGLATVYGIVKQHNGFITVYSELHHGTTFHIYLPAVKAQVDQEQQETAPIATGKETILIAEDNEEVRHFIREILRQFGYKTIEAIDGEDAVDKFKQHRDIDLIIVDSVMPKKNGREVYEEIRRVQPRVRALFTSGYTKDIILDKGIEDSKFDFIAKPLSPRALLQKVREVLDR